jgi:hypothetical protein
MPLVESLNNAVVSADRGDVNVADSNLTSEGLRDELECPFTIKWLREHDQDHRDSYDSPSGRESHSSASYSRCIAPLSM